MPRSTPPGLFFDVRQVAVGYTYGYPRRGPVRGRNNSDKRTGLDLSPHRPERGLDTPDSEETASE